MANLRAVVNISASGTVGGSNLSGTNTGDQDLSYLAITGSNVRFTNITSSGNISASGGINSKNITSSNALFGSASIDHLTVNVLISGSTIITSGSNTFGDGTEDIQTLIGTTRITGSAQITGSTSVIGNIISSGNISASGTITAEDFIASDDVTINGTLLTAAGIKHLGDTDTEIFLGTDSLRFRVGNVVASDMNTTKIDFNLPITASSDISSSGTLTAAAAVLTTANINGGTIDSITSLTAGGDLDIGAHKLRAETFESDIATGTAPFTVASTTAVTNLQSSTATTLHTARNINGVSFNGSANITVPAAGSTLSDTVTVAKGGTGATSFDDKAVIITQDSGTDTLASVVMDGSGELLIGGSNGPEVSTLTGGNGIDITNSRGAISIATTLTAGDGLTLNTEDFDIDAAQTTITSILAADLVLGEDTETKIDFETANEIHFDANNAEVVNVKAGGIDVTGHITSSGNISASGQVFDNTYYQWEVSVQADTNDDTNWQGPPNTGITTGTVWNKDFGTVYDGTSNIVQSRSAINNGWRIPHSANYSCSIKNIDVYVGGRSNVTIASTDHLSASLWYSTAADINERLNQTGTTGITQRHGGTVITTQVGQTLVKFNQYHISQSINVDLAPGAMLFPRVKMADGSSQNLLWDIYWIINYCKKSL